MPGNGFAKYESCDNHVDYDYYPYKECDKKDSLWKCYDSHDIVQRYDSCSKIKGEYRCYNYDDYEECDRRYGSNDDESIFAKIGNWFYREKIINSFWLIVVGVVAAFIITRKSEE